MKLQKLTYQRCSVCKSRVVSETQDRQHTNGQWNESQTFECGAKIVWSPNFQKEMTSRTCPYDKDEQERHRRCFDLQSELLAAIAASEADEKYRERLRACISHTLY